MNNSLKRTHENRGHWQGPQTGLHVVILVLLLLSLLPTYLMISVSFKHELQYLHETWSLSFPLRLGNYRAAWEVVQDYIFNTTVVALGGVLGVLVLSLIGGFVFARMKFPLREPLYFAIISLLMVPWVLTFIPAYMIYYRLNLLNTIWALIIPELAGGPVFGIFLMRSVIAGIPEELYEAARVDGAGLGDLIWRITLPLALPGLATLAVLNFIGTWNSFLWPLTVITDKKLQLISVGLYTLQAGQSGAAAYGPLFASFVIASLPLVIVFIFLGRFYVEGLVESGIKA